MAQKLIVVAALPKEIGRSQVWPGGVMKAKKAKPHSHTSPGKVSNMASDLVSGTCRSCWW